MKALFVGIGSIGARHLKNLTALCEEQHIELEVTALRSSEKPLPPELKGLVHREERNLEAGEFFDAAFITGPTNLHAASVGLLKGRANTFFIEKPIFESAGYDLELLGLDENQKAYVAAPMRWCGVYGALKEKLASLPVYSARAICSSYLPGWRPAADYREIYSAKRSMGGGVALDLVHEWDYLTDLFGMPEATCAMRGKFSELEIDSDDLAVYIARWPSFLCELHLDYFGRRYRRELELFSERGSLVADFGTGLLTLPGGATENHAEDPNRRYEREMEYFVRYVLEGSGESLNSPKKALAVVRLALGQAPEPTELPREEEE